MQSESHRSAPVTAGGTRGRAIALSAQTTELPRPRVPPCARGSSSDQAAHYIRALIFDGHLHPGSRVPQELVAKALGISRIPVREALVALERDGWVTIETHRGAFVNTLDAQALLDHYELFGLLYGFAAERALRRNRELLIERLRAIDAQFDASVDAATASRLSVAFQAAVVDAAASPRLRVLLRAMSTLTPTPLFELVPSAIEIQRQGIAAITRAMARGDADRAACEYARLLERLGRGVVRAFQERGLVEPIGRSR
jgi:DNA-binding GntR family transcriptional regulator